MLLYACTSNRDKLAEFIQAGGSWGLRDLTVEALPGLGGFTPPEENGATYEENASIKAVYYSNFTGEFVFADDSGIEADALGNAPGVHSAHYAGPGATYMENNSRLLRELEHESNRKGRFICAIALAKSGVIQKIVKSSVDGEILERVRGDRGFGYDPLFFYPPLGRSFGELSGPEKFGVSARGRAFRLLLDAIAD